MEWVIPSLAICLYLHMSRNFICFPNLCSTWNLTTAYPQGGSNLIYFIMNVNAKEPMFINDKFFAQWNNKLYKSLNL